MVMRKVLMGMAVMGIAGSINSYASVENQALGDKHLDPALEKSVAVGSNPVKIIIDALDANKEVFRLVPALGKQIKERLSASLQKFNDIPEIKMHRGPTEYWTSHIEKWKRRANLMAGAANLLCEVTGDNVPDKVDELYNQFGEVLIQESRELYVDPILAGMAFMDPITPTSNWNSAARGMSKKYTEIIREMSTHLIETEVAIKWFFTIANRSLFVEHSSGCALSCTALDGFRLVAQTVCDDRLYDVYDEICEVVGAFDDEDDGTGIEKLRKKLGDDNAKKIVDSWYK